MMDKESTVKFEPVTYGWQAVWNRNRSIGRTKREALTNLILWMTRHKWSIQAAGLPYEVSYQATDLLEQS